MVIQASGLSGGEVAGLIVAVFWGVLVCFLAYVLVKLGKVIGEAAKLVSGVADQTVPLLGEVTTSVVQVNAELTRVDAIASNVEEISTNARAMTSLFSATLGSPMIKVAAFSYGVRRAMKQRDEADVRDAVKREMKLQRAARKAERKAG
ncbi:MAG TPA: DUF948 domain-containing protein [Mycobacteriales bacterium]|jgi:uncharacterized protein YoxC|nr:DUF948 domain-containing protein [Mycobacteriales bacterium]